MRKSDPKLLDELRNIRACEVCLAWGPVEIHHIYARGQGDASRLDWGPNCLAVCRGCHQKIEDGNLKIGRLQLPATKRDLWGIATEREVYKLLRSTE